MQSPPSKKTDRCSPMETVLWPLLLAAVAIPIPALAANNESQLPAVHPLAGGKAAKALKALLYHLPRDVMAVYVARPLPHDPTTPSSLTQLSVLIRQGRRMGLLPKEGQALADIIGSLPLLGRFAHAVALLDITSRPLPGGGYRLKDMQLAVLFYTAGDNGLVTARIQALLDSYTKAESNRIETVWVGSTRYHRLTDEYLPAWAVFEWGQIGDLYVATFGQGAFEKVIATGAAPAASLARDEWFIGAHGKCKGTIATIECALNIQQIFQRLEEVIPDRPEEVRYAIGAEQAERLVWTVAVENRAITSYAMVKGRDRDFFAPISDPSLFQAHQLAAIPPGAGVYAIVPFDLSAWVQVIRDGYLASRSESNQDRFRDRWADIEADLGFRLQKDLLDHLGHQMIIHTYPPHPLRVPLLCTLLLEIRSDPQAVRERLENLLTRWQQHRARRAREAENPLFAMRVKRTEDGIWYLQAGLNGPGLAFVDRWIVISYSPEAVRANVAYLRGKTDSQPVAVTP